jgi:putative transposase
MHNRPGGPHTPRRVAVEILSPSQPPIRSLRGRIRQPAVSNNGGAKLGKQRLRFTDAERKRLARIGTVLGRKALRELTTLGRPDTAIRWYRQLVAKKYDGSKKRGPGRPRKPEELRRLVVRFVLENRGWGYTRIDGAMKTLGCIIGRTTIVRILDDEGLPPETTKGPDWKTCLQAH